MWRVWVARSRKADPTAAVVLIFTALAVTSWLSGQPTWLKVLLVVSAVTTSWGYWWLFQMPTTCKVANRSNPRGCGNNVKGALRACRLVDHQERKRRLLWARLTGRRAAAPSPPPMYADAAGSVPMVERPRHAGPPAGGEWLPGAGYHLTMLACAVLGAASGVVSVIELLRSFAVGR